MHNSRASGRKPQHWLGVSRDGELRNRVPANCRLPFGLRRRARENSCDSCGRNLGTRRIFFRHTIRHGRLHFERGHHAQARKKTQGQTFSSRRILRVRKKFFRRKNRNRFRKRARGTFRRRSRLVHDWRYDSFERKFSFAEFVARRANNLLRIVSCAKSE